MIRPESEKEIVDQDMADLATLFIGLSEIRNDERTLRQLLRSV